MPDSSNHIRGQRKPWYSCAVVRLSAAVTYPRNRGENGGACRVKRNPIMRHLLEENSISKIKFGPNRYMRHPTHNEEGALFLLHRPLRPFRVMVDRDLLAEADRNPQIDFLLGILSARDLD